MLFNSFHFVFFFIAVTAIYFSLPYNRRWILLLAASCYFYMAFIPIYILILGFTIVIDYFSGIYIENTSGSKKKMMLIASLTANIGVLAVFKYYGFFHENFASLLKGFALNDPLPYLNIILPIGLSFHTFQAMSYTIEVYRGKQKAEKHFGIYSLYVMFYPQLVAGPIERPQNLLPQFREQHDFEYSRVVSGLKLMLWGFFKKLFIADRLAIYVNAVYNNPDQHSGNTFAIATVFFAFQIYCDFSGYSDIAIGAARVMGFRLMNNFNRPYLAKGFSAFWKRWHISLSSWFKDYLYISLGGNRVSIPRWYFNILFVFLVSGLWHGASWTFIIWGVLHGLYLVFSLMSAGAMQKIASINKLKNLTLLLQIAGTFVLTCFAWIFFRANNVTDAFSIINKIFSFSGAVFVETPSMMIFSISGILLLLFVEIKHEFYPGRFLLFNHQNGLVRNIAYAVVIILILMAGVFDGGEFIYFQF